MVSIDGLKPSLFKKDQEISFTIPGRLCPNNVVTRKYHNRSVPNPRGIADEARIRQIVKEIADQVGWERVEEGGAVEFQMTCWNALGDIDGRQKVVFDALGDRIHKSQIVSIGRIYDNDKRVKRLIVEDKLDHNGPRYDITIRKMAPPTRPPKPRSLRFKDLKESELQALITNTGIIINPSPGKIRGMRSEHVPQSWRDKAQRLLKKKQ